MTLPELPALRPYATRGYSPSMKHAGKPTAYAAKSVEARERILVAEIERLRALWMAAEERAAHAEEAALSHAEKIERLRASLQIEKDAAALSYKNGMALGEQLHDCQCTVRELRAEVEAMRAELRSALFNVDTSGDIGPHSWAYVELANVARDLVDASRGAK